MIKQECRQKPAIKSGYVLSINMSDSVWRHKVGHTAYSAYTIRDKSWKCAGKSFVGFFFFNQIRIIISKEKNPGACQPSLNEAVGLHIFFSSFRYTFMHYFK